MNINIDENMEENQLYHLFLYVSKLTHNKTHEKLEKIGLYRGQPPLLFSLWKKDGKSRKELGDILVSQPATITKMIHRLESSGFVESKIDEKDSRVSRVYLTTKGREIKGQVEEIYNDLEKEVFEDFSNEDKNMMKKLLIVMKKNIRGE